MDGVRDFAEALVRLFFDSPVWGVIVSGMTLLAFPVFLYYFPMKSREASYALRRMRDEHIARSIAKLDSALDVKRIMRLYLWAFSSCLSFWLLFSVFLYFGIAAYLVLAIPGHTITFLATRSLLTVWVDFDFKRSRFHLFYLALALIALLPGIVLYVIRFIA